MSAPTTPVRSIARSTPSTPPSTCNGSSPPELTPRSKVKAILVAIDDDSDSEPTVRCQGQVRKVLSAVDATVQKVDEREEVPQRDWLDEEEEQEGNEDEGDEESLWLPRGKLAAGLGRQAVHREALSWNNEEAMDENSYARIRKRLISGNSKKLEYFAPESEDRAALGQREGGTEATIPSRRSTPDLPSDHAPSALDSPVSSSRQALSLKPEGESNALGLVDKTTNQGDSDSELPANPRSKQRLLELVARKKAEREATRAAGDKKRKEKAAKQKAFEKEWSEDATLGLGMSDEDSAADKILTQHARPTRKASKKAIEEISRETQRMSRNMQLAHQAKTKKKITKESFFARFNFRTTATSTLDNSQIPSSSTVASSAPAEDLGEARDVQSPPTSPIEPENSIEKAIHIDINKTTASIDAAVHAAEQTGEYLPDLLDIMSQTALELEKGKAKAVDRSYVETATRPKRGKEMAFTQPFIKIRAPSLSLGAKIIELDSDSDLEVVPTKKLRTSKADIFDRLPADNGQEGRSLQTLRALAHLTSPGRTFCGKKATMSLADMQISLQRRARQQAIEERAAKIEDLRSRGIVVQTAEERQHDQAEVEDMIEKARREGDEIMQKEKRAAKKTKIANGEVDDLPDTSDEDDDYREDQGGEPEVELSGSEEGEGNDSEGLEESILDVEETENEDEEGGISVNKGGPWRNGMVVDKASEDGNDGEEQEEVEVKALPEDDEQPNEAKMQRSRKKRMVIDDEDDDADDEDDQAEKSMIPLQTEAPVIETPALPENPFNSNGVPMGMTQAFAATMANSQTQADDNDEEQDSMAMFDSVPKPNFPMFDTNDSPDIVEDSQVGLHGPPMVSSKEIELQFSQSQIRYNALGDTQDLHTGTQLSEIPDPTQDIGFALSSPAPKSRFISEPPSTVETVLLSGVAGDGSPVKKRGRLHRRVIMDEAVSDVDENPPTTSRKTNAFDTMRKATKAAKAAAAKEAFDKKKSEAKGMVEEQAQESEDEYAGLGGASDEDSGEEDEDVKAMMDHGEIDVDESKLAGFHA